MTISKKITPLVTARHEVNETSENAMAQAAPFSRSASSSVFPTIEKRTRELEEALHERDMVVQMLTQRLEQAADQLDRVQRTGSDRRGSAIAGIPPELMEGQQTLLEQMNRMLGEWEEIQAGPMLSRIESQISELKDLVSSGPPLSNAGNARSKTDSTASSVITPAQRPAQASQEPTPSGWEAIKAAMLANESLGTPTNAPMPGPTSSGTGALEPSATRSSNVLLANSSSSVLMELPPTLPDPPPFVDVEQLAIEELREAVQLRDEYISMLIRRIVAQDQSTRLPDWETLNHVPSELRSELESLRQQLQQKLRIAEVDLSLQRARLAREDAKLQVKADLVTRQMRQLGLTTEDAIPSATSVSNRSADGQQGRRWLQFLQRSAATSHPAEGS